MVSDYCNDDRYHGHDHDRGYDRHRNDDACHNFFCAPDIPWRILTVILLKMPAGLSFLLLAFSYSLVLVLIILTKTITQGLGCSSLVNYNVT